MRQRMVGIMALVVLTGCGADATKDPFVPDPALQAKRKELVQELIDKGVFAKVTVSSPGSTFATPEAWVTPTFGLLDFDTKQQFCNVVYALYFPDPDDTSRGHSVRLKDSLTGKTVGSYTLLTGLTLK